MQTDYNQLTTKNMKNTNGMPYERQRQILTTLVKELRGTSIEEQKEILSFIAYNVNKESKRGDLELFTGENYVSLFSRNIEGYDIGIYLENLGLNEDAHIEWTVTGHREIFKGITSISEIIDFTVNWLND